MLTIATLHLDLALKALSWIVKQLRPLKASQLAEALAVEHNDTAIDPDALVSRDDLLEMCCGFLTIDGQDHLLLAHQTIHEFLTSHLSGLQNFGFTMTKICLKYLQIESVNRRVIGCETLGRWSSPRFTVVTHGYTAHPFLAYSTRFWASHYRRIESECEELVSLVVDLLQDYGTSRMTSDAQVNLLVYLRSVKIAERVVSRDVWKRMLDRQQPGDPWSDAPNIGVYTIKYYNHLVSAFGKKHFKIAQILLLTKAVDPRIGRYRLVKQVLELGSRRLPQMLDLITQQRHFDLDRAREACASEIAWYLRSTRGRGLAAFSTRARALLDPGMPVNHWLTVSADMSCTCEACSLYSTYRKQHRQWVGGSYFSQ